jgi:hypothetical protein
VHLVSYIIAGRVRMFRLISRGDGGRAWHLFMTATPPPHPELDHGSLENGTGEALSRGHNRIQETVCPINPSCAARISLLLPKQRNEACETLVMQYLL